MKFGKPHYDAQQKVFVSEIKEGFRCEAELEDAEFKPPITSFLVTLRDSLTQDVLRQTNGWFSKPLTEDWLRSKIELDIPTDILNGFEGSVCWQAKRLTISKEKFIFHFEIDETREAEKVMIDLLEQSSTQPLEVEDLPLTSTGGGQLVGVGPTRRRLMKEAVMEARAKAGRALFKAERLTVEYSQLYGEDTDWEEDSESDSESD